MQNALICSISLQSASPNIRSFIYIRPIQFFKNEMKIKTRSTNKEYFALKKKQIFRASNLLTTIMCFCFIMQSIQQEYDKWFKHEIWMNLFLMRTWMYECVCERERRIDIEKKWCFSYYWTKWHFHWSSHSPFIGLTMDFNEMIMKVSSFKEPRFSRMQSIQFFLLKLQLFN